MAHPFNEEFRFGSASWATEQEIKKAGLFRPKGLQIGFFGKKPVYSDGDAPLICIAGAGGGKHACLLSYILCKDRADENTVAVDLRGELAATSIHNAARYKQPVYIYNPFGLHGLPQDRVNLFDLLKPDCPKLHSNAEMIAINIIRLSGSSNGKYFELTAQGWVKSILIALTLKDGYVDVDNFMRAINAMEGDIAYWQSVLDVMLSSEFEDVRRAGSEILMRQQEDPRSFGSFMGEVYAYTTCFNNPQVRASLTNPTFSMKYITDPKRSCKIFIVIPAEYIEQLSTLVSLFGINALTYKTQAPSAPRLNLIVDEAGQLGRADFLIRSYTYGRGAGVRAFALFQDVGQIKRHYGAEGVQQFLGSSQTRIFFAIRDIETARMVSDMLGEETLEYDDKLKQSEARRQKRRAVHDILNGKDPFEAAGEYRFHKQVETYRSKQSRKLRTPDEILRMDDDKMIAFMSGKGLNPMELDKRPYFCERHMAGYYLSNPHHPPKDRVQVKTFFGMRWRKIVTEPVPSDLQHLPQYSDGTWQYVQGYRPKY
jgi:type IV secretion system protein VirD4